MCGISGTVGLADSSIISAMNREMYHRGPDDHGVFIDQERQVALGHRRLSIIDISKSGHQPMSYADGRFWITFNGEIYNYREIRLQLEAKGHHFVSNSDTEVLIAAYSQWGENCVDRFRGMFAFAIYDRDARSSEDTLLFLARDRLGIKPLYYALKDKVFSFATEIKGLLASGQISRKIDRRAIWHYLSLGSIPQPQTILADVKMLMPGHFMKISGSREIKISRYWDIAESSQKEFPNTDRLTVVEAHSQLRGLLENATQLHLIADVSVGAFLSGGIDSTAVVGLMSRAARERIRTYSVGFTSQQHKSDERKWARIAAQRFETDHTEVIVSGEDIARQYDDIIHAIDQPSLDGTNTYIVSKAAGESVKVALSGLGGDELFAGYPHFKQFLDASRWDQRLRWLGPVAKKNLLNHLPRRIVPNRSLLLLDRVERYVTLRNLCGNSQKSDLIRIGFLQPTEQDVLVEIYRPWLRSELDVVSETSYVEVQGYLVNTLLRDVDAMAMANSLEVRPVLLDHKLAEFVFALPSRLKLSQTMNKPTLVGALGDLLPDDLVHRAKMGFELPLLEWLSGPLQDRARSAFSSQVAKAIFSPRFLQQTTDNLRAKQCSSIAVWAYFNLLEWLQTYRGEF